MKIAILGMGGVGATVASALSAVEKDLIIIARGKNKEAIVDNGLFVKSKVLGDRKVVAGKVSDNPDEIGIVDVLIIACKGYSLKEACEKYKGIVGSETIVIPLLNGVSAPEKTREYLGEKGIVAPGYIYCFSQIVEPGVIENFGDMLRMGFAFEGKENNKNALLLEELLKEGGMGIPKGGNPLKEIWKKFIMMGGNSAAFIYYGCPAGPIQEDPEKTKVIETIYHELRAIGQACGVELESEIVDGYMEEFAQLPPQTTSSLYRDIAGEKEFTELESVLGDGCRLAEKLGVDVPYVKAAYEKAR